MCSGCSGDYAGGFDSDDRDEAMANAADSVHFGGLPGTSDRNLDEKNFGEKDLDEADGAEGSGLDGGERPEDDLQGCEILVTETQIIEIRVISAVSQAGNQPGKTRAASVSRTPGKHSAAKSAKYYQTRRNGGKTFASATISLRISHSFSQYFSQYFSQALAAACKTKFGGWILRARRLLRRCTAHSI